MPLIPNVFLFHGDENFFSKEKIKTWKSKYIEKYGDFNLDHLSGNKIKFSNIREIADSQPFLADKRLLIIEDFLKNGSKDDQKLLTDYLEQVPSFTVLVFIENQKADGRLNLFKTLKKNSNAEEFSKFKPEELMKWIEKKAGTKQIPIDRNLLHKIPEITGDNLWNIENELDKLKAYSLTDPINFESMQKLLPLQITESIFALTDSLSCADKNKTRQIINRLFLSNEDLMRTFHMLVRQFRLIIQSKGLENFNQSQLAQELKIHPFVAGKLQQQSRKFTVDQLQKIHLKMLQIDQNLKNGKIKITTEDQRELLMEMEKIFE
jgi:DNA polymerase-3 subunit delta